MKLSTTFSLIGITLLPVVLGKAGGQGDIDQWQCNTDKPELDHDLFEKAFTYETNLHYCVEFSQSSMSTSSPACAVVQPDGSGFCFNLEGCPVTPERWALRAVAQNLRIACGDKFHDGMNAYMWNNAGHHCGQIFAFQNTTGVDVCGQPQWTHYTQPVVPGVTWNNYGWKFTNDNWRWFAT